MTELVRTHGMADDSLFSFAGSSVFSVSSMGGEDVLEGTSFAGELSFARGGLTNL